VHVRVLESNSGRGGLGHRQPGDVRDAGLRRVRPRLRGRGVRWKGHGGRDAEGRDGEEHWPVRGHRAPGGLQQSRGHATLQLSLAAETGDPFTRYVPSVERASEEGVEARWRPWWKVVGESRNLLVEPPGETSRVAAIVVAADVENERSFEKDV